jgi:hypothetical protein
MPTCFVIQGFGEKTDLQTGRKLNLDASYRVIKEAVEEAGPVCIRADEIPHSATVDVPMYQQILNADPMIADLSTYNVNAANERPFAADASQSGGSTLGLKSFMQRLNDRRHSCESRNPYQRTRELSGTCPESAAMTINGLPVTRGSRVGWFVPKGTSNERLLHQLHEKR